MVGHMNYQLIDPDNPDTWPRIHTHDLLTYRKCRRLFDWTATPRRWLTSLSEQPALWTGTGFHFALEDFHGYHRFPRMADAFSAYMVATFPERERARAYFRDVHTLEEDEVLSIEENVRGVADYYQDHWEPRRNEFESFWIDGEPQNEVYFEIPIPDVTAFFAGTFDGMRIDNYKNVWIAEYKTAAKFDTIKLETDPQVSYYLWAAQEVYQIPIAGVMYQQHRKICPAKPEILKDTKNKRGGLSKNKSQSTTYSLYRQALQEYYGADFKTELPNYVEFLNWLSDQETPEGDLVIRRDLVRRNDHFIESTIQHIQMQAREIIATNLAIYPNHTYQCGFCSFRTPCLAADEGDDPEEFLKREYIKREVHPTWRKRLQWPDEVRRPPQSKSKINRSQL